MIKANELRVGNWVLALKQNERTEYTPASDKIMIDGNDISDKDYKPYKITVPYFIRVFEMPFLFRSIPLTPEILEVCGFKDEKEYDFWLGMDNGCSLVSRKKGLFIYDYDCPNDDHAVSTNVRYLHQLQNLYFALTGEELEVNL